MIEIQLIRHGMTEGNKFGRYIGITDEPLSPEGCEQLKAFAYHKPEMLFVSPMVRCRETAKILFPGCTQIIIDELKECNFGEFENKNYKELSNSLTYQVWIDSNGTMPFPGGESPEEFKSRSLHAFETIITICHEKCIKKAAIVAHGGSIMSIMEKYGDEKKSFYEWHVKNGCGYTVCIDSKTI